MATIITYQCDNCDFSFAHYCRNRYESMLKNEGGSSYYCVNCKEEIRIFIESDMSPIRYRIKDYLLKIFGINKYKCPKCGSLELVGTNVVSKCPECNTGHLATNDPLDQPCF